jgi:hypothetical protein
VNQSCAVGAMAAPAQTIRIGANKPTFDKACTLPTSPLSGQSLNNAQLQELGKAYCARPVIYQCPIGQSRSAAAAAPDLTTHQHRSAGSRAGAAAVRDLFLNMEPRWRAVEQKTLQTAQLLRTCIA